MKYEAPIIVDSDGELILQLDDKLCKKMGWEIGDDLLWKQLENGNWSLKKREDSDTK